MMQIYTLMYIQNHRPQGWLTVKLHLWPKLDLGWWLLLIFKLFMLFLIGLLLLLLLSIFILLLCIISPSSSSYLLIRYLNTLSLQTDLLQFCNFMSWRSTFISFQALTALDFMLLVPYNTVLVLKLTSWFNLSPLVLPAVCTKVVKQWSWEISI